MRPQLLFLLTLSLSAGYAQSKKEIKKYDIQATTITLTDYVDGKELARTDSYEKYDKHGNVLEEINYDKAGRIKEKIVRKFNRFDDKVEEVTVDADNRQLSREVYQFNELGEKVGELKYDSKNTLVSRAVYTLDRRGLKTEKKTYDPKGTLLQLKKYKYRD
jgi:hypothetical protein